MTAVVRPRARRGAHSLLPRAPVFDSEYFRTTLQADVDATDKDAVVELHLLNGHTHRLRSVLGVHGEYVTLETYQDHGPEGTRPPRWQEATAAGTTAHEVQRSIVAYEAIAAVTIRAVRADGGVRVGFLRP